MRVGKLWGLLLVALLLGVLPGCQGGSGGCPKGTIAYYGWSGEYPDPILQFNKPVTLGARADVCDRRAKLKCTVAPGLYHPWSQYSVADFKSVGRMVRYQAQRRTRVFEEVTVDEGAVVTEQFYLAEGICSFELNGQTYEDDCSEWDSEGAFKELRSRVSEFPTQQYFEVECGEGYKGWVHVTEKLMAHEAVQEGEMAGYGAVEAVPLPGGGLPFQDKWERFRTSSQPDLLLAESEGPFWIIAITSIKDEARSKQKVQALRADGWDAHMAWLGYYGSAKYRQLWVIYIGPWSYRDRAKVEQLLPEVRSRVSRKAYGVTLGEPGAREKIR